MAAKTSNNLSHLRGKLQTARELTAAHSQASKSASLERLAQQLRELADKFASQKNKNSNAHKDLLNRFKQGLLYSLKRGISETKDSHKAPAEFAAEFIQETFILSRFKFPKYTFPTKQEAPYEIPAYIPSQQVKAFQSLTRDIAYDLGLHPHVVAKYLLNEIKLAAKPFNQDSAGQYPNISLILKHLRKNNIFEIKEKFDAIITRFQDYPEIALTAASIVLVNKKYKDANSAFLAYDKLRKAAETMCKENKKMACSIAGSVFASRHKTLHEAYQANNATKKPKK